MVCQERHPGRIEMTVRLSLRYSLQIRFPD